MKTNELRWLLLATLAALLVVSFTKGPPLLGVSRDQSNSGYYFSAGTHPLFLVLALLMVSLCVLLMIAPASNFGDPLPGLFRRFLAFWIDFFFFIFVASPILGVVPILIEWRRTGVFEWNFERATPASGDGVLAATGVILGFLGLLFYHAYPLIRCKPTPATCILNYQIVSDDGEKLPLRRALLRSVLGFIAVCFAYLAPFVGRERKNGKFWLDKVFETRAVKVK